MLKVDDASIETDEDGFLLEPEDWDEAVARAIAANEGLQLDEPRWAVVTFVREYFEMHRSVPEARKLLKHLEGLYGKERATRRYLYELFPYGYGQQACKVAGMRKPLKLWLDL